VTDLSIQGEYIELCKLLKVAGLVMSGGEGKSVVAEGQVPRSRRPSVTATT